MYRLSADYHEQTPTGEKLTRFEHDIDEIANLGADTANQSIRAALFFVLSLAMMMKLSVPMTLAVLPLLPLFAMVQRRFRRFLKVKADAARDEIGSANSLLNEQMAAVPQIQFLGAEEWTSRSAVSKWDGMLQAQRDQRWMQVQFSLSVSAILVAAIIVAMDYGGIRVLAGSLTGGGLVAFSFYVVRIFEPVSSAMDLYARLQSVGASIRRVRELLALEPTVKDLGTRQLETDCLHQGFEMRGVSFSYKSKPVLENLSLRIKAGERIAIIGASGSGKSTLARLLVRAADPDAGSIQLEGHPIDDYTLASLRGTVCYVQQLPVLFDGSVRDNLLYANPNAQTEELHHAIAAAQFASTLERLPEGLDTSLGPGAIGLSGGERQRLAIARSLLRRSAVLVLDESTSALDAPTERAVLSSIASFAPRTTLVLISHRISSLAWVDRFILLDRGGIVATGRHEALYADSALYRSLFDASANDAIFPSV
jgi:ABC-type multidrug transport system fused ATPase/permease subunit